LVINDLSIWFPLTLTNLLRFSQHLQLGIPIGFERIGYEPIVGSTRRYRRRANSAS
jgi:hypothetical protein